VSGRPPVCPSCDAQRCWVPAGGSPVCPVLPSGLTAACPILCRGWHRPGLGVVTAALLASGPWDGSAGGAEAANGRGRGYSL
jgi:hypothetical protein